MSYFLLGNLCFLLFIIYDLNQIDKKQIWIKPFFAIGFVLLCYITWKLITTSFPSDYETWAILNIIFHILAATNLFLLVYSLFFAFPIKKAYVDGSKQELSTSGIYALSRHPGIIFFTGFYFFLGLGAGKPFIIGIGLYLSFLNLIYALIEDRFIFPKLFNNYNKYKYTTPFVIPTKNSLKKCITYFKK